MHLLYATQLIGVIEAIAFDVSIYDNQFSVCKFANPVATPQWESFSSVIEMIFFFSNLSQH